MRSIWKKQVPAFLLTLVMILSLVPMAEAKSNTVSYKVDPGKSVTLQASDFNAFLGIRDTLQYIKLSNPSGLDRNGGISTKDNHRNAFDLDERDFPKFFVYDSSSITDGDYMLTSTVFTADGRADGETVTFDLRVYYNEGGKTLRSVDGKMEFVIGRGSSTPAGKGDINYSVDSGRTLNFNAADFYNHYRSDKNTTGTMTYLKFTDFSDLDSYGTLFAVSDSGRKTPFQEKELSLNPWFYYDGRHIETPGDYNLDTLQFTADPKASGVLRLGFELVNRDGIKNADTSTGVLEIVVGDGKGSSKPTGKGDINYAVDSGKMVNLNAADFYNHYKGDRSTAGTMTYLKFTDFSDLDSYGTLFAVSDSGRKTPFQEKELGLNPWFYYDGRHIETPGDYDLDTLQFMADPKVDGVLRLGFELVDRDGVKGSNTSTGVLEIVIGDGKGGSTPAGKGDINYELTPGKADVAMDARDFADYFKRNSSGSLLYVEFTDSVGLSASNGMVSYLYGYGIQKDFNASTLEKAKFYYEDPRVGDYDLGGLSFVAANSFSGPVELRFRAYGTSSSYVDGTVTISSGSGSVTPGVPTGPILATGNGADIRYTSAGAAPVQIRDVDIARYYKSKIPNGTLQSVTLSGVPVDGAVVYNYYSRNVPGGNYQMILTGGSYQDMVFSATPTSYSAYTLSELYYVPTRINTCSAIPFVATGTGGSVSGTVYIGVTQNPLKESYGAFNKGTTVPFPALRVQQLVQQATGLPLAGVRFLELPTPDQGTLMMKNDTMGPLNVTLRSTFGYSVGDWRMDDIYFVPNPSYTGNVELPYAAYDATARVFATGVVSMSFVKNNKALKDVDASTWCYKYATELFDAGIISGYEDHTFREKNTLTWRAAMKLICRANGLGKPTDSLESFVALAQSRGWAPANVVGNKPITRLEFCQVAAKSMGLAVSAVPQGAKFSDTSDPYVLALNNAGIIGGYPDGTFKPNNTLTRGHISAIIWRMNQFK